MSDSGQRQYLLYYAPDKIEHHKPFANPDKMVYCEHFFNIYQIVETYVRQNQEYRVYVCTSASTPALAGSILFSINLLFVLE